MDDILFMQIVNGRTYRIKTGRHKWRKKMLNKLILSAQIELMLKIINKINH
jgi:hypothetical protein